MNTLKKIAKNTSIMICGNIASTLLGVAATIYLTRYLGAERFGIYSFVFAYLGFFNIVIDFGVSRILVREISRDKAATDKLIGNTIVMRLILSVCAILLAVAIINFLQHPFSTRLLVYVASVSFLLSVNGLYVAVFQANLKMEYPTLLDIANTVLKLGLFIFLIYQKASLAWFILATALISLPGLCAIIFLARKLTRPKLEIDLRVWKNILSESWPLALTSAFIMVYTRIDQLMLFQMKDAESLGYYAAAVRLVEIFNIIPAAFMASVFPLFSEYFVTSAGKLVKAYDLSFRYMSALIIPIAVGTFILSDPIVKIIYGQGFLKASPPLQILIWSEIFVFLGTVGINIMISEGTQKLNFVFTSLSAAVNVLLNFILIPRYSIAGAAIATTISYGLPIPLLMLFKQTRKFARVMVKSTIKPIIAAITMGYCCYTFIALNLPLILIIVLSAAIYLISLIIIKGLDTQDWKYLGEILPIRALGGRIAS